MKPINSRALFTALMSCASLLPFCANAEAPAETSEIVVKGHRLDKQPNTTESNSAEDIARTTNLVTPEDTLRYMPNVLIRQRHIGDTQSPVTTRTSGVGASARSLIYVDGILLSTLIGNNNSAASPKWGLVPPEAVARVDVMYGPFSAAYAGNSLGSVIEFTTRMPKRFEATAEIQGASQAFRKYGDDDAYGTGRIAGSVGNRFDRFAFRLSYNHLDSHSQPLSYATATVPAANSTAGTVVTGAFDDSSRSRAAIKVLGATGLEHQVQDNVSGRFTYDLSSAVTAAYTVGIFNNTDDSTVNSYLRDGNGNVVYSGALNIGGKAYTVASSAFANGVYHIDEAMLAQAVSLSSHSNSAFDYELVATQFDYQKSRQRVPTTALPGGFTGGAGTDAVWDGTGWTTFDAKGTWRPQGVEGMHIVTFGLHQDSIKLSNPKYALTDWASGADGALLTLSQGRTRTTALWFQDVWRFSPTVKATLGARLEDWRAYGGQNYSSSPALNVSQPELKKQAFSPKLIVAYTPSPDWTFKGSLGVAYRFPTVGELYQAITTGTTLSVPNPNLRPERAVSSELSVERNWAMGSVRVSAFTENISNALLSQSAPLVANSTTLYSYVQNVDRTSAHGVEVVADQKDVFLKGLELSGWVTYVDARIDKDTAFAAAVGKALPQLPRWRGALVATYSPMARLDLTLAARYSDRSFAIIDNSDSYANTYQGFSGYFVVDAHIRYRINDHVTADIGVNNLNDRKYFLFHPFPQRTVLVDLKYRY